MTTTYEELNNKLGRRVTKKLRYQTWIDRLANGNIAIRHHETNILTFSPGGEVEVNTGGWKSATTKQRINDYIPSGFKLIQKNRRWYWAYSDGTIVAEYNDCDKFFSNTLKPQVICDVSKRRKQDAAIKRIKKYAKAFAAQVPLPYPDGGDCWYCHMQDTEERTLGDALQDTEHLDSHIKENYFVPSLMFNALREAKVTPLLLTATFNDAGYLTEIMKRDSAKHLEKYLIRRLVPDIAV